MNWGSGYKCKKVQVETNRYIVFMLKSCAPHTHTHTHTQTQTQTHAHTLSQRYR